MEYRDERLQLSRAEPRLEALDCLRCECDFRHEHDRTFALLQRVRDGLQIDFRLTGAGDAVQEEG
jgi:hypothetical protein